MFSKTRNSRGLLYFDLTQEMIPASSGCSFLVVFGRKISARKFCKHRNSSFLPCAECFTEVENFSSQECDRCCHSNAKISQIIKFWSSKSFCSPSSPLLVLIQSFALSKLGFHAFPMTIKDCSPNDHCYRTLET